MYTLCPLLCISENCFRGLTQIIKPITYAVFYIQADLTFFLDLTFKMKISLYKLKKINVVLLHLEGFI